MSHFEAGNGNQAYRSGVGPILSVVSVVSVVVSGVGRAERGLVSRKDGGRSGRAGFERGCIRDTARIQRVLIGDRYALLSERVTIYPIKPDQAIKIVAAFRMHVSPAKHSFGKCDRKVLQTDGQTDKVIPMCRYASQATQKLVGIGGRLVSCLV